MKNAAKREIPDFLLTNGREVYQGKNYMDGKYIQKAAPKTRRYEKPAESKIVASVAEALKHCGAKSGMTFSFHHHLRDGDYVVNMVMKAAIEELGLSDLTIAKKYSYYIFSIIIVLYCLFSYINIITPLSNVFYMCKAQTI